MRDLCKLFCVHVIDLYFWLPVSSQFQLRPSTLDLCNLCGVSSSMCHELQARPGRQSAVKAAPG